MKKFIFQDDIKADITDKGVSRRIMGYDESVMLVSVDFEKDSIGALHSHPHVQTSYVASGRFEVNIGGEKQVLSAGDGFFAPSGVEHGVICIEAGRLIDVFAPMRKDFL